MKKDQLFSEIQSHMQNFEDVWYKRTEEGMEVYIADIKEFFVDDGGYVEQYNNVNGDEHYYEINDCLLSAAELVREYDKAMQQAPDLNIPDLTQPYKLLAKYNNIVLSGKVLSSGSFEFVTWRQNEKGLEHGNYFGNNYAGAKEDFAVRSGLVNENKLFSNEEYMEIYRCVCDTLEGEYEVSDSHREILESLCQRLPEAVDNFEQLLKTAAKQEDEQFIMGMK